MPDRGLCLQSASLEMHTINQLLSEVVPPEKNKVGSTVLLLPKQHPEDFHETLIWGCQSSNSPQKSVWKTGCVQLWFSHWAFPTHTKLRGFTLNSDEAEQNPSMTEPPGCVRVPPDNSLPWAYPCKMHHPSKTPELYNSWFNFHMGSGLMMPTPTKFYGITACALPDLPLIPVSGANLRHSLSNSLVLYSARWPWRERDASPTLRVRTHSKLKHRIHTW